jgi:hypothetical protein
MKGTGVLLIMLVAVLAVQAIPPPKQFALDYYTPEVRKVM